MTDRVPDQRTIGLLDYDPELGRGLRPERFDEARRTAMATMVSLPRGVWELGTLARRSPYGVLLLEGLLSREVLLSETISMQLLGRGDLLAPGIAPGEDLVTVEVEISVLEPAAIALLDERFLLSVRRWPEVVAALFERLAAQSARVSTERAVCQLPRVEDRVHALLWFLAERWGRMTPQGVIVPLRLTHDVLGRLVGAKRPTVSLAVKALAERGAVHRRPDGAWLLGEQFAPAARSHAAPTSAVLPAFAVASLEVAGAPPPAAGHGRGFAPAPVAAAEPLQEGMERVRHAHAETREDVRQTRARPRDVRRRSAALRRRLGLGSEPARDGSGPGG